MKITTSLSLLLFIFLISCSDNKGNIKQKSVEKEIKSELIGTWKIDSITDTRPNSLVQKTPTLQGYIFKENGNAFIFEKTEHSLKEILQGKFEQKKDTLNITLNNGIILHWFIEKTSSKNNIILKANFNLSPSSKIKPIVFLSKTSYDSISM